MLCILFLIKTAEDKDYCKIHCFGVSSYGYKNILHDGIWMLDIPFVSHVLVVSLRSD